MPGMALLRRLASATMPSASRLMVWANSVPSGPMAFCRRGSTSQMDSRLAAMMLGLVVTPAMGKCAPDVQLPPRWRYPDTVPLLFLVLSSNSCCSREAIASPEAGVNQRVAEIFMHDAAGQAGENTHMLIARGVFVQRQHDDELRFFISP
jgi:hypothetical protein